MVRDRYEPMNLFATIPHLGMQMDPVLAQLDRLLAGNANGPSLIQALATAGVARPTTLTDQWDAWREQPAHQTTTPLAAGEPAVVSPLAAGADLLRVILDLWTEDRLLLGMDASDRRDDVVLVRLRVRSRGMALPVAWVLVLATTPGAWAPQWERRLAWAVTVLDATRLVVVVTDQGVWSPQVWHAIRDHGWHPVMRVQDRAMFTPTGAQRQRVRDLAGGSGRGWIGTGTAFTDAAKRLDGTLATVWDPQGVGSPGGRAMGAAHRSAPKPTEPGLVCPAHVGCGRRAWPGAESCVGRRTSLRAPQLAGGL
jgi:hypothetical protein